MKILPDNRIQVEQGDTLAGIYGSNWKAISGYTGDPKKLPVGSILPPRQTGVLSGTLPPVIGAAEKTLPETPIDNLSVFQSLLKKVSEKYGQESMVAGMEATGKTLGVEPSKISGKSLAGIVDFIKKQATPGIADIYKSTTDLLKTSREAAEKQLTMIINQNALPQLNDEQLVKLSGISGMDIDYLTGMKRAQQANLKAKATGVDIVDEKRTYDLRVAQAPSQVLILAKQGYSWGEIADYFTKLNIDPGIKEIDDALHRQFQTQAEYEKWKKPKSTGINFDNL